MPYFLIILNLGRNISAINIQFCENTLCTFKFHQTKIVNKSAFGVFQDNTINDI